MKDKLLLFLLMTLPFERVLTFDFFGFTAKLPYFAGALLIIFSFYDLYIQKKLVFAKDEILLLAFVFWSYLSILWSIDKKLTFIVSTMFLLMAGIYVAIKRLAGKEKLEYYFYFFIWLGVAVSAFGLYQFFGDMLGLGQSYTLLSDLYVKRVFGFPRIQSTFFEPGFFANFLLIPLYLSFYFALNRKNSIYKGALFVIGTAFFLTLSRGGIFSFAITYVPLVIVLTLINKKIAKNLAVLTSLILLSFITSLLLIFSFRGLDGTKTYLGQSVNSSDVVNNNVESKESVTRGYTVRTAIKNWRTQPVLGIGTGAFGALPEFKKIRDEGNLRQTVNSLYPEILVEEGIVGLLLFLSFISYVIIQIYKKKPKDTLSLVLIAIILSVFVQYASFSTLYFAYLWVFLALALPKKS